MSLLQPTWLLSIMHAHGLASFGSFAFCHSNQTLRWNDAPMKRLHHRLLNDKSSICSPPPTPPPPSHTPAPNPWSLRTGSVSWWMDDGWAPCSCWEKRGGGSLYFSPEQSDEFSSLKKADSRLYSLGVPWNPWSLRAWRSYGHFSTKCTERTNSW